MHTFDSDSGFELPRLEAKVVVLPLKQKAPDCVSDRTMLANLGTLELATLAERNEVASKALGVAERVNAVGQSPNHGIVDGEENLTQVTSDRQLKQFISNLLKYGVFLATATVLVGGVLYLMRYGTEPANYQCFRGDSSVFSSPKDLITAVLSGQCHGIIQLGLLILVATPIARVAFSVLAFLRQRDFTYVVLTLLVLSGLIYSLIGGYV